MSRILSMRPFEAALSYGPLLIEVDIHPLGSSVSLFTPFVYARKHLSGSLQEHLLRNWW